CLTQRVSLLRFTVFDDPWLACGCLGNETSATGRLFRGCWNNLKFPAARDSARAESFRRGSDPRLSVFGRRLGARHGRVGSVAGAPPRRNAATNSPSAVSSISETAT